MLTWAPIESRLWWKIGYADLRNMPTGVLTALGRLAAIGPADSAAVRAERVAIYAAVRGTRDPPHCQLRHSGCLCGLRSFEEPSEPSSVIVCAQVICAPPSVNDRSHSPRDVK